MNGLIGFQQLLPYCMRGLVMLMIIPAHEAAHAAVSMLLGDETAKNMGRLSLNPFRHFDPMGAVCMIVAGVGWAKPVPIGANHFKHPKIGMALTAAAGPLCNLFLAAFGMVLYKISVYLLDVPQLFLNFLYFYIFLNINLAVFNLIPVPPWDGSRIMFVFLPTKHYFALMRYEKYVFAAFFVLLLMGVLDGFLLAADNYVWNMLVYATGFIEWLIY